MSSFTPRTDAAQVLSNTDQMHDSDPIRSVLRRVVAECQKLEIELMNANLATEKLLDGRKIVLPVSRSHAIAMGQVADFYLAHNRD